MPRKPQIVPNVNTTIGGLPKKLACYMSGGMTDDLQYIEIGGRLRLIRKAFSGDTQKMWADRHNLNRTQVNNWERGLRRVPVDVAEKMCDTYGLTLDFIYRGRLDGISGDAKKALIDS